MSTGPPYVGVARGCDWQQLTVVIVEGEAGAQEAADQQPQGPHGGAGPGAEAGEGGHGL